VNLYKHIIGNHWVYDRVRPWFLGGLAFHPLFDWLRVGPDDVVLDVGCGTGMALHYLTAFQSYHGFDIDAKRLEVLKARHPDPAVHVHAGPVTEDDLRRIRPSRVILAGLLHHLSDMEASALLRMLAGAGHPMRIVTLDVVHMPGKWMNNLLAVLDRGRYVRSQSGYVELTERSGLKREQILHLCSGNGLAHYLVFCLRNHIPGDAKCSC
jgi:SAM-dependent methyltransferase